MNKERHQSIHAQLNPSREESVMSDLKGESLRIIVIILLGWSSFSFADGITKYLSQTLESFHPAVLLSISGMLGTLSLSVWIILRRGWKGFLSPNWKWLIARGACIGATATGMVNALSLMDIADVYGITFSAPFISVCLAYFLLKEQVGWHRWMAVIVGFIGVIILLGPQFNTLNHGILYAILAALSIAAGTIVIRKIGKNEYMPLFLLYPFIGILCVNIPLAIPVFEMPPTSYLAGYALNFIFVIGGQLGITYAISNAKTTASVAPFVYIQVIWGLVFGYFFFNTTPTLATFIGLVLIVSAGLYMVYRERQLNKKPAIRSI